jgi:hypothetical protein
MVTLKVVAFAPNQEGFYSLVVRLRFQNSKNPIQSDYKYNLDELTKVGQETRTLIQLTVPSAVEFSLDPNESLEGQLQYILFYSEAPFDGDKSEQPPYDRNLNTEQSLGWETITEGQITNPFINLRFIATVVVISVIIIGSAITLHIAVRKRSR